MTTFDLGAYRLNAESSVLAPNSDIAPRRQSGAGFAPSNDAIQLFGDIQQWVSAPLPAMTTATGGIASSALAAIDEASSPFDLSHDKTLIAGALDIGPSSDDPSTQVNTEIHLPNLYDMPDLDQKDRESLVVHLNSLTYRGGNEASVYQRWNQETLSYELLVKSRYPEQRKTAEMKVPDVSSPFPFMLKDFGAKTDVVGNLQETITILNAPANRTGDAPKTASGNAWDWLTGLMSYPVTMVPKSLARVVDVPYPILHLIANAQTAGEMLFSGANPPANGHTNFVTSELRAQFLDYSPALSQVQRAGDGVARKIGANPDTQAFTYGEYTGMGLVVALAAISKVTSPAQRAPLQDQAIKDYLAKVDTKVLQRAVSDSSHQQITNLKARFPDYASIIEGRLKAGIDGPTTQTIYSKFLDPGSVTNLDPSPVVLSVSKPVPPEVNLPAPTPQTGGSAPPGRADLVTPVQDIFKVGGQTLVVTKGQTQASNQAALSNPGLYALTDPALQPDKTLAAGIAGDSVGDELDVSPQSSDPAPQPTGEITTEDFLDMRVMGNVADRDLALEPREDAAVPKTFMQWNSFYFDPDVVYKITIDADKVESNDYARRITQLVEHGGEINHYAEIISPGRPLRQEFLRYDKSAAIPDFVRDLALDTLPDETVIRISAATYPSHIPLEQFLSPFASVYDRNPVEAATQAAYYLSERQLLDFYDDLQKGLVDRDITVEESFADFTSQYRDTDEQWRAINLQDNTDMRNLVKEVQRMPNLRGAVLAFRFADDQIYLLNVFNIDHAVYIADTPSGKVRHVTPESDVSTAIYSVLSDQMMARGIDLSQWLSGEDVIKEPTAHALNSSLINEEKLVPLGEKGFYYRPPIKK